MDLGLFLKEFKSIGRLVALKRSDSDWKRRYESNNKNVDKAISEEEEEIVKVLSEEVDEGKAVDVVRLMREEAMRIDMSSSDEIRSAKKDIMNECRELGFSKEETEYLEKMFDSLVEGYRGQMKKIKESSQSTREDRSSSAEKELPDLEKRESKSFLSRILPFG